MTLPDGKEERVRGTFPLLRGGFSISYDGKEIIYADEYPSGKLVMIENLH